MAELGDAVSSRGEFILCRAIDPPVSSYGLNTPSQGATTVGQVSMVLGKK